MYREWFGLTRRPFDKTPDPGALFLSDWHQEALARLEQAVEDRDIVVVAGDVGAGKTTLVRALLDRLPDSVLPVVLVNPVLSPLQLLRQIARGLEREPARQLDEVQNQISDRILELYEADRIPYLVIDEAQLLRVPEGFEQLRLLTNFQLDDRNLMAMALMGQPELKDLLADPRLMAFNQRVGLFYFLPALNLDSVARYVHRRLQYAGGHDELVDASIWAELFALSRGVPRRINQIMHNAFLLAYGRELRRVGAAEVQEAAKELWL